jgi:hypothetical protein
VAKYALCRPINRDRPAKRNHEFESNPLRQSVWRFCFSVVIRARRSILRPLLRGFRKCRRSLCAPEQQTGAPQDIFLRRGSEWLSFAGQTQPRVRIDCPRAVSPMFLVSAVKKWSTRGLVRLLACMDHRWATVRWAGKQEKLRPPETCFFLTSPFIEFLCAVLSAKPGTTSWSQQVPDIGSCF